MSEQNAAQTIVLQQPLTNNPNAWKTYWEQQGQPWRTEPEIDLERQKHLDERRSIKPDTLTGIYPFKDIRLSRADVEWLLATHDNGRGPVNWKEESQHVRDLSYVRKGLDLRGADLRTVNLTYLPLAHLLGGDVGERGPKTDVEYESEAIHLEKAQLGHAHLEGAYLSYAYLEGADFSYAYLNEAQLGHAHLDGTRFLFAKLDRAWLFDMRLEGVNLSDVSMEGARLSGARLNNASLAGTNLKKANLFEVHLEGADLTLAHLDGAHLAGAFFDSATKLKNTTLGNGNDGYIYLADVHWGDVNLGFVDWSSLSVLGDEPRAEKRRWFDRRAKIRINPVKNYANALRAYRQLAIVLRNQGLNEDAARFTYRAQLMQRKVFRTQRKTGQYIFSLFLDLLAGYGYKPLRSFLAYLLVIIAFATTYFIIGQKAGPVLSPLGSLVFSMTSFHGRGFFPGGITLDDPMTVVAAFEAFIGLLIEVTFIATLTQRLFGK